MSSGVRPSTRRGLPAERDAARVSRLLDVGLDVFGTEGYGKSAIEAICAQAGVGTRSFYQYFDSKEDLLVAVYERVIAGLGTRMLAALAEPTGDFQAWVRSAVRASVTHITSDQRAARVQLLEVVGVSARLEHRRREVMHDFARVIRDELARMHGEGYPVRPPSPMLAMAVVGGTNELLIDWLVAPTTTTPERLVDVISELYLATMGQP